MIFRHLTGVAGRIWSSVGTIGVSIALLKCIISCWRAVGGCTANLEAIYQLVTKLTFWVFSNLRIWSQSTTAAASLYAAVEPAEESLDGHNSKEDRQSHCKGEGAPYAMAGNVRLVYRWLTIRRCSKSMRIKPFWRVLEADGGTMKSINLGGVSITSYKKFWGVLPASGSLRVAF